MLSLAESAVIAYLCICETQHKKKSGRLDFAGRLRACILPCLTSHASIRRSGGRRLCRVCEPQPAPRTSDGNKLRDTLVRLLHLPEPTLSLCTGFHTPTFLFIHQPPWRRPSLPCRKWFTRPCVTARPASLLNTTAAIRDTTSRKLKV